MSDFSYELPEELIAKRPTEHRSGSRMLTGKRAGGGWEDGRFASLAELLRGDELVVNNARVIPARLLGRRAGVRSEPLSPKSRLRGEFLSAEIELLLLRPLGEGNEEGSWEVLARPGRKVRVGEQIVFGDGELRAEVVARGEYGLRTVRFSCDGDFRETVERLGHVPLPPYINREDDVPDRERYQTVYAKEWGAVAAPTAGLHFTPEMLEWVRERGCEIAELTLEVGYGTFQPMHTERIEEHKIHSERYRIPEETAEAVNRAKDEGRPVLAVGTTVVRALESAGAADERVGLGPGRSGSRELGSNKDETNLFIYPGYEFRAVDQLLTNFHLPESSLLVLVCAFAGRENVLAAYRHAVEKRYRFFSYGDCMLIR